jgi:hypothetical protein
MEQPPKTHRWYNPPLPDWFPGWLVACVAVGTSAAVTFYFGLDGLSWQGIALCFGGGFGFTLVILSLTHSRVKPADRKSGLFPPTWVRRPVFAALLVGPGMIWVDEQKITTGAARGDRIVVHGPAAVALGIGLMAVPVPANVMLLRRRPRQRAAVIGGIAALLVVAAGLGFAMVRIIKGYA